MESYEELEKRLSLLSQVNRYKFEMGLFENSDKEVKVKIVDTDNIEKEISMKLEDILYQTEEGTLTIPRRPILSEAESWLKIELEKLLELIYNGVINGKIINEGAIYALLQNLVARANIQIKVIASSIINSNSSLSSLLKIEDTNKYLYDLNKLSDYISCRLFKI